MEINNVFSPVPFYKNKKYWHSNKWYTYGQKCPIMMTSQNTLPFQLVVDSGVTLSSFTIKKADNDTVVRTVSTSGNYFNIAGESYNVIQVKACAISALPYGNYYYALTLSDGSTYISDIIAIISDMSKCIKITYKNVENLYFSSGHIDFSNDFIFELYLPTTIGKPEYEYEEELTKRLGYKFLESQVVNKVYKFTFPATEQMCDAYRFVRMCDYIRIDTYNPDLSEYDHYNVIYLSSEVDWLDNGDIASIETSFETDSIVQKLQDYSRTQLVNFYNALLSNSDVVLKFDDETIAQYYNNYLQSIDGKMIRQLDAASSISDNTVIAIDENNGIGAAKKILLKPLITSVVGDELKASEILQNFQAHINNGDIHITAQERALLSLFALDENGDVYLKDKRGFYSNSFISAKGKSDGGSSPSGASALYQLVDVEKNDTDDGVQGAETGKVLMYNGTKWYAGTVNTGLDEKALKTYLDNNKYTTTDYVDTKVSEVSTELNNLLQGALNNKVDTAFFARVFGLLDANGNEIAVNDVTTVADSIKAKFGLWTEQYISALGKNDNTSGSASALYQLVDILPNATNDGVYGAETGKVLMYNGTKWYAGTIDAGLDEKALKVYLDANKYTTTSYVDSKVSAVSTKLDNFLEGSDTDGIINKWKELEAFLAGQTQTSTLAELLAVKADKSTKIVAGNGLTGGGDLSSTVTLSLASSGVTAGTYTKVTVDTYGRVTTGTTLSSSDIPNIAISQVNGLQVALNNKVDTAFFARVFGLLDANGNEIAINDVTTVADSIKAKFGLWTEQYISALGKNPSSGSSGGASALYQLVDVLANSTNDGVLNAANGSVLMYNGTKWQAGNVVTDISPLTLNVNGSKLFTYDGKSSVTANLTVPTKVSQLTNDSGYLTAITKAQVEGVLTGNITSHTHNYLPLSGGTLTGALYMNSNIYGPVVGSNPRNIYGAGFYFYNCASGNTSAYNFGLYQWVDEFQFTYRTSSDNAFKGNAFTIQGSDGQVAFTKTPKVGSTLVSLDGHTHSYLPLSGGTMTGALNFCNNTWNLMGDDAYIGDCNVAGMIGVKSLNAATPGFVLFNNSGTVLGKLYASGGTLNWSGSTIAATTFSGNAATATALTTSAGSATLPIYFSSGKPVACTASSVFSNLSNSGNSLSVTVAGQNRTLTVNYASNASNADTVDGIHERGFYRSSITTVDGETALSNIPADRSGSYVLSHPGWTGAAHVFYAAGSNSTFGFVLPGGRKDYVRVISAIDSNPSSWSYLGDLAYTSSNVASATNADMIDSAHLSMWYKHARALPNGRTDKPWHKIATFSSSTANQINTSIAFYISEFYTDRTYGIFTVRARAEINAISLTWLTVDFMVNAGIPTTDIVATWKHTGGYNIVINVYACRSSWRSYSFRKIEEQAWGSAQDAWVTLDAFDGNDNCYASIPSDENKTTSVNIDISNNVFSATKLQTARTIWGQSFDGTANVSGALTGVTDLTASGTIRWNGSDGRYTTYSQGVSFYIQNKGSWAGGFQWVGTDGTFYNQIGHYVDYVYFGPGTYNAPTNYILDSNGYVGLGIRPTVRLHVAGDIAATGAVTAKASSSDIRLKTDITDYKALSIIRSHKSIKYHWNEVAKANADVFNDDYWHYGLIAQDVQRDMPQMVSDVFKDYLVINYERLIPICWKGLQEVDDEVTRLKKKVRKLEMEIRELKQKEDRL